jgi:hypothetical protein
MFQNVFRLSNTVSFCGLPTNFSATPLSANKKRKKQGRQGTNLSRFDGRILLIFELNN